MTTDDATALPSLLRAMLAATHGPLVSVERLGGMSRGTVFRVRLAGGAVIVKGNARLVEVRFYQTIAPRLNEHGVATPGLEWAEQIDGRWWLVLEEIPCPLPRERWLADPEVIDTLGRIHRCGVVPPSDVQDIYRPSWTGDMSEAALSLFSESRTAQLTPRIEELRMSHQHLFAPTCPISGDPNPLNWGTREDGTPVLFDWERFSMGAPALDLAISLPGLGDVDAFRTVAARYLQGRAGDLGQLAGEIAVAKLWSVIELLSNAAQGGLDSARTSDTIRWLVAALPEWISALDSPG